MQFVSELSSFLSLKPFAKFLFSIFLKRKEKYKRLAMQSHKWSDLYLLSFEGRLEKRKRNEHIRVQNSLEGNELCTYFILKIQRKNGKSK